MHAELTPFSPEHLAAIRRRSERRETIVVGSPAHYDYGRQLESDRDALLTIVDRLSSAVAPLAKIAAAYDDNKLDGEARRFWGKELENENVCPSSAIELYSGRGGKRLLTLADAFAARDALAGAPPAAPTSAEEEAAKLYRDPCSCQHPGTSFHERGSMVCLNEPREAVYEPALAPRPTDDVPIVPRLLPGEMGGPGEFAEESGVRIADHVDVKIGPLRPLPGALDAPRGILMTPELFGAIWDAIDGSPEEGISIERDNRYRIAKLDALAKIMPRPDQFPAAGVVDPVNLAYVDAVSELVARLANEYAETCSAMYRALLEENANLRSGVSAIKLDHIERAIRNFPEVGDGPITPDLVARLANEYAKILMTWAPFPQPGSLDFVDDEGRAGKLTFVAGDTEAGIGDGWSFDGVILSVDEHDALKKTAEDLENLRGAVVLFANAVGGSVGGRSPISWLESVAPRFVALETRNAELDGALVRASTWTFECKEIIRAAIPSLGKKGEFSLDDLREALELQGTEIAHLSSTVPSLEEVIASIELQGGRCRDCADVNGMCENGLPCSPEKKRDAILTVLSRFAYWSKNPELFDGFRPRRLDPDGVADYEKCQATIAYLSSNLQYFGVSGPGRLTDLIYAAVENYRRRIEEGADAIRRYNDLWAAATNARELLLAFLYLERHPTRRRLSDDALELLSEIAASLPAPEAKP